MTAPMRGEKGHSIFNMSSEKSNTTPKKGGLMNPLKGGNFGIHFHRRDAEHAEDLFNFFLCDLCVSSEAGG